MPKYNVSVTVTAAEKRYIIRDLADAIEGRVCEQLGVAHDCNELDPKTDKLVKEEANKLYDPYIRRLLKAVSDELDLSGESIDLVFDLSAYAKAADRISNRKDVQERIAKACDDERLARLQRQADRLGYKVVLDD